VRIERFIQHLDEEQARVARQALERPAGKEAFDYGRVAGYYAGLERAKQLYVEMFAEKERREL
jgi:hypothetical protein